MKAGLKMYKTLAPILIIFILAGCASTGGPRQTGGAIIGAVGGGLIGSQFGGGKGRIASTIAGTAIGGLIGSEIGQKYDREEYYEERHYYNGRPYYDDRRTTHYYDEPVRTYRSYR